MKKKHLVAAIGLVTLGSAISTPAPAATSNKVASNPFARCEATNSSRMKMADCACEAALSDGSASMLHAFVVRFAREAPSTACGALASTAIDTPPGGGGGGGNPYG